MQLLKSKRVFFLGKISRYLLCQGRAHFDKYFYFPMKSKQSFAMECISMVIKAAFGPRDPGSNPGWFAISNSN